MGLRLSRSAALALAGGLSLGPACAPSEESPAPDVVLVVIDTLRADYLPFLGGEHDTMPYLARLAEEGRVFPNAVSTSSWTAPSTASLLTGVYADRHGVHRGFFANLRRSATLAGKEPGEAVAMEDIRLTRIHPGTPTLAERFGAAGYRTYGLATNINIGTEIGFERGFDRFERHDEWSAEAIHGRLLEWKDDLHGGAGPSFLYLHLNDVHKPYELRPGWWDPTPERPDVGLYRSEMGYLDHWLERMLTDLEPDPDTLLVVVSDHGEEFGDRGGSGHHNNLHAEVNRIVMLFHGPQVEPGVSPEAVSGIDLAPTLLELAGLPPVEGSARDGVSLAPLVVRGAPEVLRSARSGELGARALFAHRIGARGHDLYAVLLDGWKLIREKDGDRLYDLSSDPGETEDRRAREPERHAALVRALEAYRARSFDADATTTDVEFDPELLDKLIQLGYVEE